MTDLDSASASLMLPSPAPAPPVPERRSRVAFARFKAYLRRHPILFLALLTPGIPEYLSGSSPLQNILLNPIWFLLGLTANLGMYVPGVLLIREAQVRWNKGWATVLTLGAAYAIVEEGIGLSTMFYPGSNPVGAQGLYGYAYGVSWVWVPEVMLIHMIFSVGVPLLLFSYALPELRRKSLLSDRQVAVVAGILTVDIAFLMVFVSSLLKFWMGDSVLLGSLVAVAALCGLAYRLPKDLVRPVAGLPRFGPVLFVLIGAAFYPGYLLVGGVLEFVRTPVALVTIAIPIFAAAYLGLVLRTVGTVRHESQLFGLALGLILPVVVIGAAVQVLVPFVLVADLLVMLLFVHLWKTWSRPERSGPPASAAGSAG